MKTLPDQGRTSRGWTRSLLCVVLATPPVLAHAPHEDTLEPTGAVPLDEVFLVSRQVPGFSSSDAEGQLLGGNVVGGDVLGGDFLSNVLGNSIVGRISTEPLP